MDYRYTTDPKVVADYLIKTISSHLEQGERVTWLITGGSGMLIDRLVANGLRDVDTTQLSVTLSDERYGSVGHPDENWQQLLDDGFSLPGAQLHRVLTGHDRVATTTAFSQLLRKLLVEADYSIGLFGIGPDGHTAGIKPHSPAVNSIDYAADFTGDDFERITMTATAILQLDEAVVAAFGEAKFPTLKRLLHEDVPPDEQPAQLLRSVKKCTIFTDYKEENL